MKERETERRRESMFIYVDGCVDVDGWVCESVCMSMCGCVCECMTVCV